MIKISIGDKLNDMTILSNSEIRKAFYFMKEGFSNIENRFKEAKDYEDEFKYYIELIRKNPKIINEGTYRGSEAREMISY